MLCPICFQKCSKVPNEYGINIMYDYYCYGDSHIDGSLIEFDNENNFVVKKYNLNKMYFENTYRMENGIGNGTITKEVELIISNLTKIFKCKGFI